MISTYNWPPWAEAKIDNLTGVVHVRVFYGQFEHKFEVPRGEATSRDTQRICRQLYLSLVDKQDRIDRATKRLFR